MIYFLTSHTSKSDSSRLNPENEFIDNLRSSLGKQPLNVVYIASSPDDEVLDSGYEKNYQGLEITYRNILPHYDDFVDEVSNGISAMKDIVIPDSYDREFLLLPDGSYILGQNGSEEIYGRAYILRNGRINLLNKEGDDYDRKDIY